MARLGSMIEQIRGVSYKPEDLHSTLNENSIILLRANNIKNGQLNYDDVVYVDRQKVTDKQLLKAGDILICASSGSRELVGKAAFVKCDLPMTFGAFCKAVRPKTECPQYIGHFFNSPYYRARIADSAAGANINNIRNEHIDALEIVWPSLDKQQYIVEVLDKVRELIALRKEQLAKLDQLVKSRFIELFGDPVASKNKRKLSEIGRVFTGNTPSMKEPSYYESNDIPFIKPSDLNESGVTYIDGVEAYVSEKARPVARIIPPQAVLVTCIGTIGKIGITVRESCCNQQINFIMPNDGINSVYLAHCLTFFKSTLQNIANAPVVPIINKTQFSELEIPVFEVDKQQRFAAFVEQTDKSKLAIQQSLDKLETLKKSLMQEYFG